MLDTKIENPEFLEIVEVTNRVISERMPEGMGYINPEITLWYEASQEAGQGKTFDAITVQGRLITVGGEAPLEIAEKLRDEYQESLGLEFEIKHVKPSELSRESRYIRALTIAGDMFSEEERIGNYKPACFRVGGLEVYTESGTIYAQNEDSVVMAIDLRDRIKAETGDEYNIVRDHWDRREQNDT